MVKQVAKKLSANELATLIHKLLQQGSAETQEDICQHLQGQGLDVNQVRISRILHKLGAVKMLDQGKMVYRLPPELLNISSKNSLAQFVLEITHNEYMIVISGAPGSAQLLARLLDAHKDLGILGTVAGDDTIFIVPKSVKDIAALTKKVTQLFLA